MSLISTQTEHRPVITSMQLESGRTNSRGFVQNASIVLVGSRGSGKRSLGFIGATHLGRRLITEDHYFEEVTGLSRRIYLSRYGNKEFCRRNVEVLQRMLHDNPTNCIIECGMGSLARDAQIMLREYAKFHPVIYIVRNQAHIRQLLKLSEEEARRFEYADASHRSCSNFEYYNLFDPSCEHQQFAETSKDRGSPNYSFGLREVKQEFSDFLDFVSGYGLERMSFESPFSRAAVPAEVRPYTHALQVKLSDLMWHDINLSDLESGGGDVVELQVDTWASNILFVISKQVSMIRRKIGLPVILSVKDHLLGHTFAPFSKRDKGDIPPFPDTISTDEETALMILHHALRVGVDYLVVSLEFQEDDIRQLLQAKGFTKVIGQYVEKDSTVRGWYEPFQLAMYRKAEWLGCDLVRLIQVASTEKDNEDVLSFANSIAALPEPHPPLIAYNTGILGRESLITNKIFTPVTHPVIKSKSSNPDLFKLTAQEAMQALFAASIFNPLHFYITGAAVAYSMSPAMHNAAYAVCGMSHTCQTKLATSLSEVLSLGQDPSFGGSAVAQPFKVAIMPHLTSCSQHAKAIGAVNTIVPLRTLPSTPNANSPRFLLSQANTRHRAGPVKGLYGDNTDWIGALTCLRRNASPRNAVQPSKTTGLIIGAGGMARAAIYALIRLGCRNIFIYNRTTAHAEAVAAHFNSWAGPLAIGSDDSGTGGKVVHVLPSRSVPWPIDTYRYPTHIVSCVPAHSVLSEPAANFECPEQWLGSPSGGVVMEMAYKPRDTPLLRQMRRIRQRTSQAWVTVDFLEVLPEQGAGQFEIMLGRKAPRERMKQEVARLREEEEGEVVERR